MCGIKVPPLSVENHVTCVFRSNSPTIDSYLFWLALFEQEDRIAVYKPTANERKTSVKECQRRFLQFLHPVEVVFPLNIVVPCGKLSDS